jgi:dinuclear metal center YbgI/SA1388 family protein
MTVKQFYAHIADRVSPSLSCDWDNDGLMLSPDEGREVRRVLCTLDVTEEAIDYAEENGFDLIISHHPLIFRPLSSLTPEHHISRKAIRLLAAGISVISLHTRADAVMDGVNDRLASLLGLEGVGLLDGAGEMIARIGSLPEPLSLSEFALQVKEALGSPFVLTADTGLPVRRVALCGGDGKDFVKAALDAGADTYVSGRIGYNVMTEAPEMGLNMIEAGHYFTETHITAFFADIVNDILPSVYAEEFASNIISAL